MAIYILNFLTVPIYNALIRDKRKLILLLAFQSFLILALRDPEVGMDLVNYRGGYYYVAGLDLRDLIGRLNLLGTAKLTYPYSYESGYVVIMWICAKIGLGFHNFLVLHAAFCTASFAVFVYRYSKKPWLSYAMLFAFSYYEYSFGILRQILAICILLWALPYVEKKKPIPVLVLLFLAFTIHRVSMIWILLYLAAYITASKLVFAVNACAWFFLLVLGPTLYEVVIAKLLSLIGKDTYVEAHFAWNHQMTLLLLIAAGLFITVDYAKLRERRYTVMVWGFLLALPFQILGLCNGGISRMVLNYMIFAVPLVPTLLADYEAKNKKLALLGTIGFYALLCAFFLKMILSSPIVPYEPVFAPIFFSA